MNKNNFTYGELDPKTGYLMINVEDKPYYVHMLVAESFVPNPNGYKKVIHINGNKTDNRAENLKWVSN